MKRGNDTERGAALLSVLLLVAVMAVIAAVMLDRLNLATRLAGNGEAMGQARLYAASAENLATARLRALVGADANRTVDPGGLLGRDYPVPLARGSATLRVEDAGNCFNLNSLVEGEEGQYLVRPVAIFQLRALMDTLQVDAAAAAHISDGIADWIDSDDRPLPNGAEDAWYSALPVPYRTSGRLIGDVSEIRAIRDMNPTIYQRLRPWLCALPTTELSPINLNTLRPEQARLVTMIAPREFPAERVRSLLASRPPGGFSSTEAFPGPRDGPDGAGQLKLSSRWFTLDIAVRVDSVELQERALVDASVTPARVAFRSWGGPDSW